MTPNILDLSSYTIQEVRETERDCHIHVTTKDAS